MMSYYYVLHVPTGELIHENFIYSEGKFYLSYTIGSTSRYTTDLATFRFFPDYKVLNLISTETKELIDYFEIIEKRDK